MTTPKPPKFEAVDLSGLREHLDSMCSPDASRKGYVIGPDVTGRLCHVASCRTMAEATIYACKLNGEG